ncbi:PAS domain-containing protein [Sneathiella chinensis]|uniref:Transcriptional regulator n=1 Tax=Sneathiella chinensis TaxID=349750 RepID=A0ABQ5U1X7_9PROT|nr:PAS domain-containing protein [Sneathiella chinensis]GLQ05686.1 transcriptional regulator [Sneathiella chinensis]
MRPTISPTGNERTLGEKDIIVSKTDLTGKITYANKTFLDISGFDEAEVLGVQHNAIRHPDMPRCIFKFLWDTLKERKEVFAYVNNLGKTGDNYWVLAHVTPSIAEDGSVLGYHSNRRAVNKTLIKNVVQPLYAQLLATEKAESSPKAGLEAGMQQLSAFITEQGGNYDEWFFSL